LEVDHVVVGVGVSAGGGLGGAVVLGEAEVVVGVQFLDLLDDFLDGAGEG